MIYLVLKLNLLVSVSLKIPPSFGILPKTTFETLLMGFFLFSIKISGASICYYDYKKKAPIPKWMLQVYSNIVLMDTAYPVGQTG